MSGNLFQSKKQAEALAYVRAREELADPHLTQRQAAELLEISVSTLVRWKARKIGPKATKFGGRVRYRLSDLREFMKSPNADDQA